MLACPTSPLPAAPACGSLPSQSYCAFCGTLRSKAVVCVIGQGQACTTTVQARAWTGRRPCTAALHACISCAAFPSASALLQGAAVTVQRCADLIPIGAIVGICPAFVTAGCNTLAVQQLAGPLDLAAGTTSPPGYLLLPRLATHGQPVPDDELTQCCMTLWLQGRAAP